MTSTLEPQDHGFEDRVRRSFGAQRMMATLAITLREVRPGHVTLEMPHDERFTQQHGYTHAGAIATALDSACGYAAFSLMPADAAVLTVENKLNLLRPADAPRYRFTADVERAGRTLTVCTGRACPADDDRPVAIMTATIMTLRGASIRR